MASNTPLRYPGGKQKLTPFVTEIILANNLKGGHYVEPYAGGAGVAIELLLQGTVDAVHLNDVCPGIFAFWKAVLQDTDEFCDRIRCASLTVHEWRKQQLILKSGDLQKYLDLGFAAFYLNRCNRSGILSGGLIGGLKQDGEWKMDARFPQNELIRRIRSIATFRDSISVENRDAQDFLLGYVKQLPQNTLVYCDPPYFEKAKGLYLNHYRSGDHARISKVIQAELGRPWIVSYDNADVIKLLYADRRTFTYDLRYSAASASVGKEVFFFADELVVPEESSLKFIDVALRAARCLA